MIATTMCVLCLKRKAATWSGHVRKGRQVIVAGWCQDCFGCTNRTGFVGHYLPVMTDQPQKRAVRR